MLMLCSGVARRWLRWHRTIVHLRLLFIRRVSLHCYNGSINPLMSILDCFRTELVALAAGESKNPQKSVPRAIKATFIRILLFYILTVLVIGLCINRNDPSLFA